jgi:hypothetical protein
MLDGAEPDREQRAWSITAILVGAIAISRAIPDGKATVQALDAALQTANAPIAAK